jgi:hypothetical protein
MSTPALEAYLALLYTDDVARAAFLDDPHAMALRHGLSEDDANALARIDRAGLQMAASSFALKRAGHRQPREKRTLIQRLRARLDTMLPKSWL